VSHILNMAPPIVAGMVTIMICQLVDLYFVAGLGEAAIAGVAAAGNLVFLLNGVLQVLGVGTVSLIAHAVGRKDRSTPIWFQPVAWLAAACGLLTWVAGSVFAGVYMRMVAADEATVAAGTTYLLWFMPALALQFASRVMGAALSGTGIVRPGMIVQALAVMINIALAPVLIAGWGTGHALGVAGAGLASSVAVLMGVLMMWFYFRRLERYVGFDPAQIRPQLRQWKRILDVGLPAGGEFAIIFLWMGVIY
jgi:Na+-driven multidrug efflux pump